MLFFSRRPGSMSFGHCSREASNANSTSGPEVGGRTLIGGFLTWMGWRRLVGCFAASVLLTAQHTSSQELRDVSSHSKMTRTQLLALPMQFEANAGQVDGQVEFLSRGQGYTLWLTKTQAVLSLRAKRPIGDPGRAQGGDRPRQQMDGKPAPEVVGTDLEMTLVGANPQARVEGFERVSATINYFVGNDPNRWRAGVPAFGKVKYHQVYPGIDLVYYGNQACLEYDFIVGPRVDLNRITLGFKGADRLEINGE